MPAIIKIANFCLGLIFFFTALEFIGCLAKASLIAFSFISFEVLSLGDFLYRF